jgi:hypothetical protein
MPNSGRLGIFTRNARRLRGCDRAPESATYIHPWAGGRRRVFRADRVGFGLELRRKIRLATGYSDADGRGNCGDVMDVEASLRL